MTYVENILSVYRKASDADCITGRLWYRSARELAAQVGKGDVDKGAGIIAALSPMVTWKESVRLASNGVRTGKFTGHFGANCRKALRIFHGELPVNVLGGCKVRAFYFCIASGGECDHVCVDRHAAVIASGRELSDAERKSTLRGRRYDEFATAYREAASYVGLKPSELQAITWVTWRRLKGITD